MSLGISFAGLSSGIDSDSIIQRLLQLEALPAQRFQRQQQNIQARRDVLGQLKSKVQALSSASVALNNASAFTSVKASSSKTDVATITSDSTAVAGTYQVNVTQLAQSHKISTTAQANTTDALNLTGKVTVNGKGLAIEATDSLRTIATKINGLGAGVTASLIDGGSGSAYLTVTSNTSGANGRVQIGDLDGTAASALGLASGALAYRETITGGFTSSAFTSNTSSFATQTGFSGLGTQSFTLNGQNISLNLDTASLQDIANAINTSGSGASATVRSLTENGQTRYKLDVTGVTTYTDADGVMQGLGLLQRGFGNQLLAAQNATFTVDGVSLSTATNTVTGVIPGSTLTLLKASDSTTITLGRDNDAVKGRIKDFMTAFNGVVDYVKANSKLDSETFQSGVLFGDPVAQQIEASLANQLFDDVEGLATYRNLAQLGFGFDANGKLELNEATLDKAIQDNPDAVGQLFRAYGQSTNSQISFVAAGSKSKASGPGGYAVNITTAASQHSLRAEAAQGGNLTSQETLTFSGSLFSSNYLLILDPGMSQEQIAAKINGDAKLKDLVTATVDSGQLVLTSKRHGAGARFNVASDRGTTGSGWGTATTLRTGTDVAGTINGEAATGTGQILTGNTGNANTDGLQFIYSGTLTGNVGNLVYTKGISPMTTDLVSSYTDAVNGLFTSTDKSLGDQIDSLDDSIASINERIERRQTELKLRFARMEEALSQLQSQGNRLNQTLGRN